MINFPMDDFDEDMKKLAAVRTDRLILREKSKQYAEVQDKYDECFHKLLPTLTEEGKSLLQEIDSLIGLFEQIQQETMYSIAFSDGVRFILRSLTGGSTL